MGPVLQQLTSAAAAVVRVSAGGTGCGSKIASESAHADVERDGGVGVFPHVFRLRVNRIASVIAYVEIVTETVISIENIRDPQQPLVQRMYQTTVNLS